MRVCSADHHASPVTRLSGRIGRSRQEHTLTPSTRAWLIIWMLWKHSFSTPSGTWLQVCKVLGSALPSFFWVCEQSVRDLGVQTLSIFQNSEHVPLFSWTRRSQCSSLHEECLSPEGRRKRIRPSWVPHEPSNSYSCSQRCQCGTTEGHNTQDKQH